MSESQGRTIRKRNPGMLQPDEEITQQFVVREHELATVLEVLRGNIDADSCQHTLIVAPRGRGKTMLLARVAAELSADAGLASFLLPVRFMEESDEVFSAADFWLEALFYLALASDRRDPEFARRLRDTRVDLTSRWRERELDERARAAVLEAADTLGRRLVLMVENLQALCANADHDFGWKLRKTLQTEPQIILIATATSHFEGLHDAREPFFELFRIISLPPLNTAQCRRLWEVVSGDTATEREIRPLEILTGGSPRFLVIVAGFARHHSMRRLMEELVRLIDDLTDTFRGDLQALPKTERRVFLAIADLWEPSTTGEIADRARMDVRTVSTMLGRLVKRGAVLPDETAKKRLYAVVERLYSIFYKLRRERNEASIVQGLLHFMAIFYSADKMAKLFGALDLEAAIRTSDEVAARFGASKEAAVAVQVAGALLQKGAALGRLRRHPEAIVVAEEVVAHYRDSDDPELHLLVARAMNNRGVSLALIGNLSAAIAASDALVDRFGSSDAAELQAEVATALFHRGMNQIRSGRADEALRTAHQLDRRCQTARHDTSVSYNWKARYVRITANLSQGCLKAAVDAFCSLYAAFVPENETMIPELIEAVAMLVTAGVPERELVGVLRSEPQKAARVAPLSIALRQRDGGTVRAPAEVLEVAADVRKRIDEVGLSPLSALPE